MARNIFLTLAALLLCIAADARTLTGQVVDENGSPLSYVSVYLKSNPIIGGATDTSGIFSFDADLASEKGEELVFSFIGYKTEERWLREISADGSTRITLVEQPIVLDGATVQAKLSKREQKKLTRTALSKFLARMNADFPERSISYPVVSSYSGWQDNRQIIYHEAVGNIDEYIKNGRDTVEFHIKNVKKNYSVVVERTYNRFNGLTSEHIKKEEQEGKEGGVKEHYTPRELDEQAKRMHSALWGGGSAMILALADEETPSKWKFTMIADRPVFVYEESMNLLGIAKYKLAQHFYVDPSTYALQHLVQILDVELHIPFGYKLDKDQLELLNLLQFGDSKIEKYRLRHAHISVKRNVFFREEGGQRVVREKNIEARTTVIDTKKQKLRYSAKSKAIVTSTPKTKK